MTTEELLQPRYKVIADFPQWSVFTHKVGDILELRGVHFGRKRNFKKYQRKRY
jgi:hypothetical protein